MVSWYNQTSPPSARPRSCEYLLQLESAWSHGEKGNDCNTSDAPPPQRSLAFEGIIIAHVHYSEGHGAHPEAQCRGLHRHAIVCIQARGIHQGS
eukprot:8951769-Pyramimonas_sp.AAC.1